MYKIQIEKNVEKELKKLESPDFNRIVENLKKLSANPSRMVVKN